MPREGREKVIHIPSPQDKHTLSHAFHRTNDKTHSQFPQPHITPNTPVPSRSKGHEDFKS